MRVNAELNLEVEVEVEVPSWLPVAARHYLEHIESGKAIRAIAREAQQHPSTIMRQIRKVELSRDDPVVDEALRKLSGGQVVDRREIRKRKAELAAEAAQEAFALAEMWRVLGRMTERGVVLVVAQGLEKGLMMREVAASDPIRMGVVAQEVIGRMALRSWIVVDNSEAQVLRYRLSATGRSALRSRRIGEAQNGLEDEEGRYHRPADNPVLALTRRKDADGNPYLQRELQRAAEYLREDYELSQLASGADVPEAIFKAQMRLEAAKAALGPSLSDVAVAVCCNLEGLEQVEKRMGWSARSAKVVLKIALERLQVHYAALRGAYGPLIG